MELRGDGPVQVVLGTMNFGARTPPDESRAILARALERGITRLDTANAYAEGASEALVGEVVRALPSEKRAAIRVDTKAGIGTMKGPPEGLKPETIARAIDASLRRLGLDRVDTYYLHKPDPSTPIADTLSALKPLLEQQKIGAWALSNYSAWQSLEVIHEAEKQGLPRPVAGQMIYNVLIRDLEYEYLAFAAKYRVHTTIFNPLAGGLLAGHHAKGAPTAGSRFAKNPVYQRRYWSDRLFDVVEDLRQIAGDAGLSMVALAYRWLAGTATDSVILGPSTLPHLDQALDALEQGPLPKDVGRAVDEVYRAYRGTDARYAR